MEAKSSFRGRRQWPQAISYPPTPSSVWGRGDKRGRGSRSSVKRCFQEEKVGRCAGRQPSPTQSPVILNLTVRKPCNFQIAPPASPGPPPGGVQSAAARTLPGAFRGAGRARARPGCASGRPGEFLGSQEAISGAIFDPRSTTFGPPWLFGELDKPRIQQS